MGFGLVLSLRPLLTGDFRRFLTLLPSPPAFPWLWLVVSIVFCCQSVVPRMLLLCCLAGFGMLLLDVRVWRI